MQRVEMAERPNWRQKMDELQFTYYEVPRDEDWEVDTYWQEKAMYVFSKQEVEQIEAAAQSCWDMVIESTGNLIESGRLDELGIPKELHGDIANSWNKDDPSIIGRFDFSFDNKGAIKLLEFNGDTPTSLYEASIVQYDAMTSRFGEQPDDPNQRKVDQFNWIHEGLQDSWKFMHDEKKVSDCHFTSCPSPEDVTNAYYSMSVAKEAGIKCNYLAIDEIGLNFNQQNFRGLNEEQINNLYKLYPWEFLYADDAALTKQLISQVNVVEPLYKMAMSSKALLPVLHEDNPHSPYLLKSYNSKFMAEDNLGGNYVRKRVFDREGKGVQIFENGQMIVGEAESEEQLAEEAAFQKKEIFQQTAKLPCFQDSDGKSHHPVIGVWVIGGQICGMGVRESDGLITNNGSRFVPHIFTKSGKMPS